MRNLFNLTAEADVIMAVATDPQRLGEVDLLPEYFYDQRNVAYWGSLVQHIEAGDETPMITAAEAIGIDLGYLAEMRRNAWSVSNVEGRVAIIRRHHDERKLFEAATRIQEELLDDDNHTDALDKAESVVSELTQAESQQESGLVGMRDSIRTYYEFLHWRYEHHGIHGLTTGLGKLDDRFQGWKPGDLVILAARPGHGKTTLALQIAAHNGMAGKHTQVYSLEMPRIQLVQRLFANIGRIPLQGLKDASVLDSDEHKSKLAPAQDRLMRAAIEIDDTGGLDIADLRRRARQSHRRQTADLIVIDYLQLLNDRTEKDRFQVVSSVSRKLKTLAKELGCVVLCLSQLSRKCEERADKRPQNSDLRESGQIEQDADIITFIYRDDVYNDNGPKNGITEIITAKFRDGEIGTDVIEFIGRENRFQNLTHQPEPRAIHSRGFSY
jgi:replicative DNA helicase